MSEAADRDPLSAGPLSADPPRTYHERAARALAWSVSGRLGVQAIRLAFGVALARLLSPREFGLLAMVTLLTQFAISIADLGFEDALVQKRNLDERHRSSVFWTMLLAGCVLALGTVAAAPRIAAFYGVEDLRPLAHMLSALFVLRAIGTVPRAIVARRLDFRSVVRIECAAAVVGGACAVALAWRGHGVTSLAAQLFAGAALESLLSFRASGWWPRPECRLSALGDLLGFSANRVATRTLGYWSQHVDELLVGKLLGVASLGLYSRAVNVIQVPVLYVSRATVRVTFPSLALIQDDPERVRCTHLRTTGAVALVTIPMSMGLFAVAEPLVIGLFGAHWREMVPLVRILVVAGLFQSITTLSTTLFLSQGRPGLHLRVNLLQSLTMVAAVLVGRRWGVSGVAVAYVLATVIITVPTLHLAGKLVGVSVADVVARTAGAFVAGAFMTVVVVVFDLWALGGLSAVERLAAEVPIGAVVYGGAIRLFRVEAYQDVLDLLRRAPPA
ncbi:MAG: lipopolysaccharide biosynthesis protein [Candidatus Binatia bacterium]